MDEAANRGLPINEAETDGNTDEVQSDLQETASFARVCPSCGAYNRMFACRCFQCRSSLTQVDATEVPSGVPRGATLIDTAPNPHEPSGPPSNRMLAGSSLVYALFVAAVFSIPRVGLRGDWSLLPYEFTADFIAIFIGVFAWRWLKARSAWATPRNSKSSALTHRAVFLLGAVALLGFISVSQSGNGRVSHSPEDAPAAMSPGLELEHNLALAFAGQSAADVQELRAYLDRRGITRWDSASAEITRLSARGAVRLDDQMLKERARWHAEALGRATVAVCARVVRGGAGGAEFGSVLYGDSTLYRAAIRYGLTAALAEIRQSPPPVVVSGSEIDRTMDVAISAISAEDARTFMAGFKDLSSAADSDVCRAGQILDRSVERLKEPYASRLARILVMP